MSIECSTGTPLIRNESDPLQVDSQNQPSAEHEQSSHRAERRQQVMSFTDSEVVADFNERSAAEALVQFRDKEPHESSRGLAERISENSGERQEQNTQYCPDSLRQQLSYNNDFMFSQQLLPNSNEGRTPTQNPILYSEPNLQNTIFGLSRAITSMQRNQTELQQKQENLTGVLQNVVTLLQNMRKEVPADKQSEVSVHRTSTVSNMTSQDQQQKVVQGDAHRHGFYQNNGNGSGSFIQDNANTTRRMPSTSNRNLTYEQGWENQTSTTNYLMSAEGGRGADCGTDRIVYRQEPRGPVSDYSERNHYQNFNDNRGYLGGYDFRRAQEDRRANYGIKLPSFDGKEDWKVWIRRFEAIAERKQWDDSTRLDNLLPKLQGRAGDFVFTQLPKQTLTCYSELVKELNSRFRVVETKRTFAAKFSQRVQGPNETAEEYAAELKRLYSKAYQSRDQKTRQEDLVRRFIDGLRDNDARFEIEYNKEPEDIDEAVYHAVNFLQTKRRSNPDPFLDKKFKRFARRAAAEPSYESYDAEEEDFQDDVAGIDHACRVPPRAEKPSEKKFTKQELKSENRERAAGSDDSLKLLTETRDLVQNLVTQIKDIASSSQSKQTVQPIASQQRRGIVCYGCNEQGHIIRDCPKRVGKAPSEPGHLKTGDPVNNRSGRGIYSNVPLN